MVKFDYLKPKSIDEAISLYRGFGQQAKYVAGGTDVMVKIREGKMKPEYLISLRSIQGLDQICYKDGELRIGALVTHRMLELSPIIQKEFSVLTDAVKNIGSVQIRNIATIGGNIVNAVPSADGAIPLMTLGANVRIVGSKGERTMALEEVFVGPGETVLENGEILIEFIIPKLPPHTGAAYLKHARRAAMELPVLGVAVLISLERDLRTCFDARIGLGVLAPTPMRAKNAEAILRGEKITDEILEKAGKAATDECQARDSCRAEEWYRKAVLEVLISRLTKKAMKRARQGVDPFI